MNSGERTVNKWNWDKIIKKQQQQLWVPDAKHTHTHTQNQFQVHQRPNVKSKAKVLR